MGPPTHDTFSSPHDLGQQPKHPNLAIHPMDDVLSIWVVRILFKAKPYNLEPWFRVGAHIHTWMYCFMI